MPLGSWTKKVFHSTTSPSNVQSNKKISLSTVSETIPNWKQAADGKKRGKVATRLNSQPHPTASIAKNRPEDPDISTTTATGDKKYR